MASILQGNVKMDFLNGDIWSFHWNLFPSVQFTIDHHWFKIMVWRQKATSHYLNQWWPNLLPPICVTQPLNQYGNEKWDVCHKQYPCIVLVYSLMKDISCQGQGDIFVLSLPVGLILASFRSIWFYVFHAVFCLVSSSLFSLTHRIGITSIFEQQMNELQENLRCLTR